MELNSERISKFGRPVQSSGRNSSQGNFGGSKNLLNFTRGLPPVYVRKTAIATGQISMPPCTCTFPFCPRSEHTIARPRSCQCPFARCTCGAHPNFTDPNHCSSTRTAAAATTTAGATSAFGLGSSATTATATAATATSTSAPAVSVGLTTTTRLVLSVRYSYLQ